jgi:hypothetical protein
MATLLANAVNELDGQTQTVEIQQVRGDRGWFDIRQGSVVGPAQGNGGMKTIGVPDDQIRICTPPNADNLNSLAA